MKPTSSFSLVLLSLAALSLIGANTIRAAGDDVDAATKAKIAEFDKGPATIDVSAYPAGIKKNYDLFREKCAQCHTLARPINCDFAMPDEWSRYVKRMMNKPGSMITPGNAKKIYEFLVFDTNARKKALYDEKFAKATPEEKTDAEKRISEVLAAYAQK
jgi:predicted small secreted protein